MVGQASDQAIRTSRAGVAAGHRRTHQLQGIRRPNIDWPAEPSHSGVTTTTAAAPTLPASPRPASTSLTGHSPDSSRTLSSRILVSGRRHALVIMTANHSSPAAPQSITRTSDRMALIGRCRDDLSRALGIARPGFPDWQVERHGVRQRAPALVADVRLVCPLAGCRAQGSSPVLLSVRWLLDCRRLQFSDTYASVCGNSHACISSFSLPSSSAIGRQITDVVTSGGQSSTKFVLRTMGLCSRRGTFAVPVTLTVS